MNTAVFERAYKFKGLSTETKPDCNSKGSIFEETDTGETFFYNGKRWVKVAEEESGGGAFFVNFTLDDSGDEDVYSADKTFADIEAAVDAGKLITGVYSTDGANFIYAPLSDYSKDYFATFRSFSLGSDGYFEQLLLSIAEDDSVTGENVHCDLSSLIDE